MIEIEKKENIQVSSVELLSKSGLSRATLNNYIKMGILPHPQVKRPADRRISRAKQIGYFPVSALETLDMIKRYKKDGLRMGEICRLLEQKPLLPPEDIQNKETTVDNGAVLFQRPASDYGTESGELFSYEETHAGSFPAETKSRRDKQAWRQGELNLLHFSVLVAEIQDARKMCTELPPDDYIDLIRRIWKSMTLTLKKHFGIYGKHHGNGAVFYFLKDRDSSYLLDAILTALELREMMKKTSLEWNRKKKYHDDLYLNIGIAQGHEWMASLPASPESETISLGDSVHSAGRLSEFARSGEIWTTKNLLNLLPEDERRKITYGICRRIQNRDVLVENRFSRVMDLFPKEDPRYGRYMDIWTLPVTEIRSIR